MTAADLLAPIRERADKATKGPWTDGRGSTSDGTEFVTTYEQKAAFLALCLNDDEAPLWLVDNTEVIPAATGGGPNAQANAEFIAAARTDIPRLLAALDGVLAVHKVDENGLCPTCTEQEGEGDDKYWVACDYPCPTVAAVTTALEGEA